MSIFGSDDHDAITLLKPYLQIHFVTGDHRGFDISKSRIVDDMNMPLDLVSTITRIEWIKKRWNPKEVVYMGDGIFDHFVMQKVAYSIAPSNADRLAKKFANYVTERKGGDRAVAEACLHLLEIFFEKFDGSNISESIKKTGEWAV